jgi:hypothetical protein
VSSFRTESTTSTPTSATRFPHAYARWQPEAIETSGASVPRIGTSARTVARLVDTVRGAYEPPRPPASAARTNPSRPRRRSGPCRREIRVSIGIDRGREVVCRACSKKHMARGGRGARGAVSTRSTGRCTRLAAAAHEIKSPRPPAERESRKPPTRRPGAEPGPVSRAEAVSKARGGSVRPRRPRPSERARPRGPRSGRRPPRARPRAGSGSAARRTGRPPSRRGSCARDAR